MGGHCSFLAFGAVPEDRHWSLNAQAGGLGVRGKPVLRSGGGWHHGLAQAEEQALGVEFRTMSRVHRAAGGQGDTPGGERHFLSRR